MSPPPDPVLVGHLVVDEAWSLDELCRLCAVEREWVVELVAHGVLEPGDAGSAAALDLEPGASEPRFGGEVLRRVGLAARLRRDLGVNAAGVALTLELLQRIEELERQLGRSG